MLINFVNQFLAVLTILSQVTIVIGVLYYYLNSENREDRIIAFIKNKAFLFSFVVALVATLGSLFYSEVAGFEPCKLCWYQRIFMYPVVLVLGLALIRKEEHLYPYVLSLALSGAVVSLYHNYIYYGGTFLASCTAGGLSESCARRFVFLYGYITIPVMALTAFLLIGFLMFLLKKKKI